MLGGLDCTNYYIFAFAINNFNKSIFWTTDVESGSEFKFKLVVYV